MHYYVLKLIVRAIGQKTSIKDAHLVHRAVARTSADIFDIVDHVHALQDTTEHDMTAIEPRGLGNSNKEL